MKELVKNVPHYAYDRPIWVATDCDGELWFYGAYSRENRARAYEAMSMCEDRVLIEDPE